MVYHFSTSQKVRFYVIVENINGPVYENMGEQTGIHSDVREEEMLSAWF